MMPQFLVGVIPHHQVEAQKYMWWEGVKRNHSLFFSIPKDSFSFPYHYRENFAFWFSVLSQKQRKTFNQVRVNPTCNNNRREKKKTGNVSWTFYLYGFVIVDVVGSHPSALRGHSLVSWWSDALEVLRWPYRVPEIEPGLATCIGNVLSSILSLQPQSRSLWTSALQTNPENQDSTCKCWQAFHVVPEHGMAGHAL